MLNKTELYYFSPTGGTRKAGTIFCKGIAEDMKTVDLALRDKEVAEPLSDLIVIALPVFGGRIPAIAAEKLRKIKAGGKKAVTFVVYGNRAYEDALLELNTVVSETGIQVIASAALIAQHSMAPEVGKGRPDEQDERSILDFAGRVLEKLETNFSSEIKVPGNTPYKEAMNMPMTPISLPSCNSCEKCVSVCPTGAIRQEDNEIVTSPEKCILCMACAAACPQQVRILPPLLQNKMEQMLGALKSIRRENEFFL